MMSMKRTHTCPCHLNTKLLKRITYQVILLIRVVLLLLTVVPRQWQGGKRKKLETLKKKLHCHRNTKPCFVLLASHQIFIMIKLFVASPLCVYIYNFLLPNTFSIVPHHYPSPPDNPNHIYTSTYVNTVHNHLNSNPNPLTLVYKLNLNSNPNPNPNLCFALRSNSGMGVKRVRSGLQRQQKRESQELQGEEEVVPEEEINDILGPENRKSPLETTFIPKSGKIWKSQAQRQKASQQRREGKMFVM